MMFRQKVVNRLRGFASIPSHQLHSLPPTSSPRQFKVVLDNNSLYIEKPLAEALGWTPESRVDGVKLSLHGWDPRYFVITRSRSDEESLARRTVESGHNPGVQTVLDYLKDR